MRQRYLRRVKFLLTRSADKAQTAELGRKLEQEGLDCEIYLSPEEETDDLPGLCDREAIIKQDSADTLWISDDSSVIKRLLKSGCCALALLHEKNVSADFSPCRYACENLAEIEPEYLERVYRRYRRLPWDILETDRCLVRETTEEDVADFYRIYSEPSITEYMEGLYEEPEQERAYARDYIDQAYSFYNFGIWTVVDKESRQVIGRAGICYREGYAEPEIGFVIAKPWQGRGYATEVCEAVLTYAREELGFSKVLAFIHPENTVSVHICRKLGLEIHSLPEL